MPSLVEIRHLYLGVSLKAFLSFFVVVWQSTSSDFYSLPQTHASASFLLVFPLSASLLLIIQLPPHSVLSSHVTTIHPSILVQAGLQGSCVRHARLHPPR